MNDLKPKLWSMIDEESLIQNLKDMVSINSVIGNETNLADYIGNKLAGLDVEPKFQEVKDGRKNVYGIQKFAVGGPLITLNGHTDTVPACDGWESDPFEPRVREGKLYGLGALDMKAGLACALEAYRIMVKADIEVRGALGYSAVIDEEGYSAGARHLLDTELSNSTAIIIGEPYSGTGNAPVPLGITGKILYEVTSHGKSAHGFSPKNGINAVEDLARVLSNLDKIELTPHPEFGSGNICTLKVEGGYKQYSVVVPDKGRAVITRLLVPGETLETALDDMQKLVEDLDLASDFEIERIPPSYNPITQSKEEEIFRVMERNYELSFGEKPEYGFLKSITDGNIYVDEGDIPTLVLGPKGQGFHESEEYVDLESLTSLTKTYLGIILDFLS